MVTRCPACSHPLAVVELACDRCGTSVRGHFAPPAWMKLNPEQWGFVELFLKCRGNLREMERELGVSYPTVRARLEQILQDLGLDGASGLRKSTAEDRSGDSRAVEVLLAVERGELSVDEAIAQLEGLDQGGK